jgi:hypothetical protein
MRARSDSDTRTQADRSHPKPRSAATALLSDDRLRATHEPQARLRPGGSRSVPAGEAFGRDAELVALRVLEHGPGMSRQLLVNFDNCGTEPHEFVDG